MWDGCMVARVAQTMNKPKTPNYMFYKESFASERKKWKRVHSMHILCVVRVNILPKLIDAFL